MKNVSCLAVLALGLAGLFSAVPAEAGCGWTCSRGGLCDQLAGPNTGCYMSGPVCLDEPNCGWLTAEQREVVIAAAKAGDRQKVQEIAARTGSIFRVIVATENGQAETVYDGWAIAGLTPGAPLAGDQLTAKRGACSVEVAPVATEAAVTAEK